MATKKLSPRKAIAKATPTKAVKQESPVEQSRDIPLRSKVLLAARSAGRCQFRGCNKDVFINPLTMRAGNFSQHAHIVAFSKDGPRGKDDIRPTDINSTDNLMVLCAPCHTEIDTNPEQYPRHMLEAWKKEHEDRVKWVTSLGPEAQSTILKVISKIGTDTVTISQSEVSAAIGPNKFPSMAQPYVVDLTESGDETDGEAFYNQAVKQISRRIMRIYEEGQNVKITGHISLFALAPIPLLIHLGHCLSNKVPVDFYQSHRNAETPFRWKWQESGDLAQFTSTQIQTASDSTKVALVMSLSGKIDLSQLPRELADFNIYEISLKGQLAGTAFLKQRQDLEAFRHFYRATIEELSLQHPQMKELVLLPAIPAPIAVVCGHDLLPKAHPALVIYDKDKASGGFIKRLIVNA